MAEGDKKDEKTQQYEYIAHQINREDQLVNFRLTWLLTINGFLLAALAFVGGKDHPDPNVVHPHFKWALAFVGLTVTITSFIGVKAAHTQLKYLTDLWTELDETRWPRPFGDKNHAFRLGLVPSLIPPIVLTLVWIYLLCGWAFQFAETSPPK